MIPRLRPHPTTELAPTTLPLTGWTGTVEDDRSRRWSLLVSRTLASVPAPDLGRVPQLKRAGDLEGAAIGLEGILGSHPHPAALAQLADVQLRRGRFEEAAAALDRAEAEAGTTAFTAGLRGDLTYREGRFQNAARRYQDAAGPAWTLLGDIERREGRSTRQRPCTPGPSSALLKPSGHAPSSSRSAVPPTAS